MQAGRILLPSPDSSRISPPTAFMKEIAWRSRKLACQSGVNATSRKARPACVNGGILTLENIVSSGVASRS